MINSNPERDAKILLRGKPVTKKKKTRWVPKLGEKYWWVIVYERTLKIAHTYYSIGMRKLNNFNYFRSKREAQKAAKAINKILRG